LSATSRSGQSALACLGQYILTYKLNTVQFLYIVLHRYNNSIEVVLLLSLPSPERREPRGPANKLRPHPHQELKRSGGADAMAEN
jgi:hypothetical protein